MRGFCVFVLLESETMAQSNWEADKMLDVYIHDYLLKRKLHNSAKTFMEEGKVATDPVAIDAPGGFLFEWWSVFWDIFIARTNEKHSEAASAYIEAQQMKTKEQQQLQMQHMHLMQQRNAQLQRRDPNNPNLGSYVNAMNSEAMMGQPSASVLAMQLYEERTKQPHSVDGETSPALIDASRMAFMKPANAQQGQLQQGNSGNKPAAMQHMQAQYPLNADVKSEVNFGTSHKNLSMDPSSIYGQAILQSKSGLGNAAMLNPGVTNLPLKGWPLTGIDQIRPILGVQAQKQNLQALNQSGLTSQQQQILAQAQARGTIGTSTSYGDLDPRRVCGVPRDFDVKDGQSARVDGSACSPAQSNSPRMMMAQMQNSSSQQHSQLQQQQLQQISRKRKQHTSAGPANSTGTGNTVGPSPNSPQSTHTTGDGFTAARKLKENDILPKSSLMYNPEGTGVTASSSNLLDDIERLGNVGSLDDNIDSLIPSNGGDVRDRYGTTKPSPAEPQKDSSTSKGFTFGEVGCIRTRNSKVTCCHFSSDGKLLASAGHDKKVVLWNMDTLEPQSTPEEHKSVITDVRFKPSSTLLGTASFDKSVRLWDAVNPSHSVQSYTIHHSPVMSLDFHPKNDLFCFCDNDNEIQYWKINPFSCARVSKGGMAQVRFQPSGQLLAAASDKVVSVFDVETDRQIHSFQGHPDLVNYICWDSSGDVLASVSQNLVKIWSSVSGECIKELSSNGNQFHSCVFHPTYSTLLVIGEISSLELWNMAENKSMTIPAHENIISALAQSSATRMVASASHDSSVKLWK